MSIWRVLDRAVLDTSEFNFIKNNYPVKIELVFINLK